MLFADVSGINKGTPAGFAVEIAPNRYVIAVLWERIVVFVGICRVILGGPALGRGAGTSFVPSVRSGFVSASPDGKDLM